MNAQAATAPDQKLSRLAARVSEIVEGNTSGRDGPFLGRPHIALDQLQTEAAISVLGLMDIQYVPRGLRELLKHMGAVSAIRGLFQALRLNFEQHLHSAADRSQVYAAFVALEEADALTEETGLDDFPVYEAIALHEPGPIHDALERLRLATLLYRELETAPGNFQRHYARATAAARKAVINWERLDRQRFLQLDGLLRKWREESVAFDGLVRALEEKKALVTAKLSGIKDLALMELHGRFERARSPNMPPKSAIALLSSCSLYLDELQNNDLGNGEAIAGESQQAATFNSLSGAETSYWRSWEISLNYLLTAAIAAILLICLGAWLDRDRRSEMVIFDPILPVDSNQGPKSDVSPR